ncbi:MAG: DUF6465 family protein [Butyrivibrio sp.]|nr:DUF6465 family protein [Butyrivibrio sp.]
MARKVSAQRAEEKTSAFATAKKNIVIQYGSNERSTEDLLQLIRKDALEKGVQDADFAEIDVYVKPEEHKVFYVVNKTVNGSIDF